MFLHPTDKPQRLLIRPTLDWHNQKKDREDKFEYKLLISSFDILIRAVVVGSSDEEGSREVEVEHKVDNIQASTDSSELSVVWLSVCWKLTNQSTMIGSTFSQRTNRQ